MYNLGCAYLNGQGVAQDHEVAVHWFLEAEGRGHVDSKVQLQRLKSVTNTSESSDTQLGCIVLTIVGLVGLVLFVKAC